MTGVQTCALPIYLLNWAENYGFTHLAQDLKTEFYTTHEVLTTAFKQSHFTVNFKQMNQFVWILEATLQA